MAKDKRGERKRWTTGKLLGFRLFRGQGFLTFARNLALCGADYVGSPHQFVTASATKCCPSRSCLKTLRRSREKGAGCGRTWRNSSCFSPSLSRRNLRQFELTEVSFSRRFQATSNKESCFGFTLYFRSFGSTDHRHLRRGYFRAGRITAPRFQ